MQNGVLKDQNNWLICATILLDVQYDENAVLSSNHCASMVPCHTHSTTTFRTCPCRSPGCQRLGTALYVDGLLNNICPSSSSLLRSHNVLWSGNAWLAVCPSCMPCTLCMYPPSPLSLSYREYGTLHVLIIQIERARHEAHRVSFHRFGHVDILRRSTGSKVRTQVRTQNRTTTSIGISQRSGERSSLQSKASAVSMILFHCARHDSTLYHQYPSTPPYTQSPHLQRNTVTVMRRQCNFDAIVHVRPFGMMIHLFCQQRCARHEGPCLVEVSKHKCLRNGLGVFVIYPRYGRHLGELLQRGHTRICGQGSGGFFVRGNRQTGRVSQLSCCVLVPVVNSITCRTVAVPCIRRCYRRGSPRPAAPPRDL
mmetsp:Transcript_3786/g.10024  ORF Transcript_3786/g.10024 Transcript_3786/m.10024 type:complete len:367 (-) Transcript_3786:225-1325(-)